MTMTTSKGNQKKAEGLLIALEKRIKEASNKVSTEMQKDHEMITNLTKTEETYLQKFQELKKPYLAMTEHKNMKRMVDVTENQNSLKDASAISSESTLSPRELFPNASNSSSNESSCDSTNHHTKFIRKVTTLREEKLRNIMGNIKESMKQRRESF
jgi:hypothetical protein